MENCRTITQHLLCVWMIGGLINTVSGSVTSDFKCTGSNTLGTDETLSTFTIITTNIAYSYVVESPNYAFTCCGVITQWQFQALNEGTLQLQVWRRMSTNVYKMIGENYFSVTTTGTKTYDVDVQDRIVVQKGDYVGWHNEGKEILAYKFLHFNTHTLDNLFRRINAGDMTPGATYDWSTIEAYNDREYGIKATYTTSATPTITGTSPVNVPDYTKTGATLTRVLFSDTDWADNNTLGVYEEQTASYFTFDTSSGYLTSAATYRPQDYTLKTTVYDQCYNSASLTQTITILPTALVYDNMDVTFTVSETQTSAILLYTLQFTDPVDQYYCEWDTTKPFMLKADTITMEYPGLVRSSTSSYIENIVCTENTATGRTSSTATLSLYITKNQPPVLGNLDGHVTIDAETAFIGDTIYTVNATDPESSMDDILTFTMSCSPACDQFKMMKNGAIQVIDWLLTTTETQYNVTVTVTDTLSNTDTGHLSISVANIDDQAIFTNAMTEIQIRENTAIDTSLYRFLYEDLDYNTKKWSASYSVDKISRNLMIHPDTGEWTTAYKEFNLEDLHPTHPTVTYTMTLSVGDSKSVSTHDLAITIINENESPRFIIDSFHIDCNEDADGTQITDGSLFTFVDEDTEVPTNGESHEFNLDCDTVTNTHRFFMTPGTGAIIFRGPYDLDVSGTPTQVECTVTVVDKFGLNDTARLHIHVNNVNEYKPEFTAASRTIYVASNVLIGTSVLTVSAVDFDNSENDDNVITYRLHSGATTLFAINEIGIIYVKSSLSSYSLGQTLGPYYVEASNYGTAQTGTATITVVIPLSTTTVTTTTDRNKSFYEDRWNYYWLLATLGGAAILILAVTLVCYRICRLTRIGPFCYRCCMKGICCRPGPPRPRGFGDKGYDLASFGHRHRYVDEDDDITDPGNQFDGWLPLSRRSGQTYKKQRLTDSGRPTPISVDAQGRFGTPSLDDEDMFNRQTPIYEMLRVNTPDRGIPGPADYLDPLTGTKHQRGMTWKKEQERMPAIKKPSRGWW